MEKSGKWEWREASEYSLETKKGMMHYYGLVIREYYLVEEVYFRDDMEVLEVGVGSGMAIELLKGRVKEFWGVDKSVELIELLKEEYGLWSENRSSWMKREKNGRGGVSGEGGRFKRESGEKNRRGGKDLAREGVLGKERVREEERSGDRQNLAEIKLVCLDVCNEHTSLGKKFDVVFSLDTLEHVECPGRFFSFVARHLKEEGVGVIIFPNECQERHHGVMWFGDKGELVRLIGKAGLEVSELKELQMTSWHRWIKKLFWEWPRGMVFRYFGRRQDLGGEKRRKISNKRKAGEKNFIFPQKFDETFSFRIRKGLREGSKIKRLLLYGLSLYASLISWLIRRRPIYVKKELAGDDIRNKRLFLLVKLA